MIFFFLGCAGPPLQLVVNANPEAIDIEANRPIEELQLLDSAGQVRFRRQLAAPARSVALNLELPPGEWRVEVEGVQKSFVVQARPPLTLEVQVGQKWKVAGDTEKIPVLEGGSTEVWVGLTRGEGGPSQVELDPGGPLLLSKLGQREWKKYQLQDQSLYLKLTAENFEKTLLLEPLVQRLGDLQQQIQVEENFFPADVEGLPDLARPAFQIPLPSALWAPFQGGLRNGRRQDEEAPWAFYGIVLRNEGAVDEDVVLRLRIEDPAFRPHVRGVLSETGEVSALLRIPAGGTSRASLPVFLNTATVAAGRYPLEMAVLPIGGDTPILSLQQELSVERGDPFAGVGLLSSSLLALAADLWVLWRLKKWLTDWMTSELMAIAMVGSALFVVGGANDLLTVSLAAVLGPFAPLLTALVGDVGKIVLLGSLLGLQPRPGTLSLAILSGYLLRGLTMGSFSPTDVIYIGSSITFGEGFAYLAGPTRLPQWGEEGETSRWLRLSLAFGGSALCVTLSGFWMQMVLFRLYYAGWYLLLQALIIGIFYPVLASRIAAKLIGHLQRVAP